MHAYTPPSPWACPSPTLLPLDLSLTHPHTHVQMADHIKALEDRVTATEGRVAAKETELAALQVRPV